MSPRTAKAETKHGSRAGSTRAEIDIISNRDKSAETHPDFRIFTQGVEIGAGRVRRGENSGKDYVSLSLAAPEFGPRKLYANLGRAAGQDDNSVIALNLDWRLAMSCGTICTLFSPKIFR